MNALNRLFTLQIQKVFRIKLQFLFLFFILLSTPVLNSAELSIQKVAILVSLNIRPYLEAVEGLKDRFSEQNAAVFEVFNMENYTGKGRDVLIKSLINGKFDLCIAVGPEAFRFIWSINLANQMLKIYTMVLNPDKMLDLKRPQCGIPLDLPGKTMIQIFSQAFPSMKRIGLLYDPKNNLEFAKQAGNDAMFMDLKIIPIEVSFRREIPGVLKTNWGRVDGLWLIPDRTVITESLVRYIIKEAISNGVAVFGYNRFFYKNGAALCYILDYREIGKETAELSLTMLNEGYCKKQMPIYKIWYNPRMLKTMGIDIVIDPSAGIKIEPGP